MYRPAHGEPMAWRVARARTEPESGAGGSASGTTEDTALNRTKIRERFACQKVPRGGVVVASSVAHPGRGVIECPAAPALGAGLARDGLRVRYAPLTAHPADRPAPRGGHLLAVSYLERDGRAAGIAAAVHPDDHAAIEAVGDAMRRWEAAMRSRRVLLAATRPACPGARRALEITRDTAGGGQAVVGYGPVTDDPHQAGALTREGVTTVTDLDRLPEGTGVVFPAHGVSLALRAEAAARGLTIIDATCPLVAAAHTEVARFTERGDLTVVIGRSGDAAVSGILGQAPESTVLVESAADVERLRPADPEAISYLVQTGIPIEQATPVVAALRARFPALRGPDPGDFCYHASDRASAVAAVTGASDLLLIAAGAGCPDARHVVRLAEPAGVPAQVVTGVADLCPDRLREAATVALTSARSAPSGLFEQIVTVLSGLGPLSVVNRQVTSDIVTGRARTRA
ncbi:4-hydroxy-3-methylbut-2-enyl diphosphate reductase [Streptosporangium canum]|uniref:4-hydroxy-3-methylbut-2-enyl diphosphate reductase n=2 Tax=Streptosporangium canum TaxID=324952 RepID=A0A1I3JPX6_9ACTN|nr:4-hydroxy-3-methylbut-2-enyl diphosphate reductase [Streptosporangium canum]